MGGKVFAQINCSLLRSKRLKECSHVERWAYLCVHLTPLGAYTGIFRYPLVMWAQDAAVPFEEIASMAARLTGLDLIEYDEAEELLRIVGFHRQRPPENASRVISLVGDFYAVTHVHGQSAAMRLRCIAEFIVAVVQRAQGWKLESTDRTKVREVLKPFVVQEWQEHGEAFLKATRAELDHATKATLNEVQSLFPVAIDEPRDTVSTPCPHGGLTRDVDETIYIRDQKKDETDTAQNSHFVETEWDGQVESPDLNRDSSNCDRPAPKRGPLEVTKRSALASSTRT